MIFIIGASGGIGRYLFDSYKFTEEKVIGTYYSHSPASEIEQFYKLDITRYEDVKKCVEELKPILNDITLLNCAGITYNAFAHKSDISEVKKVIDTNILGIYNCIREFLPVMRNQKYGRIINFSSVVALKPTQGTSAYAASKSALWGLAKSIATENAILNITINSINLGYTELGMIEMVPEGLGIKLLLKFRWVAYEVADILNTVNYIRSTKYLTGAAIDLNGGLY